MFFVRNPEQTSVDPDVLVLVATLPLLFLLHSHKATLLHSTQIARFMIVTIKEIIWVP